MSFNNFKTYGESPQKAFETLCTQLFERYLRRKYGDRLIKFRVINAAAGDGGIEAYGELDNGDIIAVQAKWFRGTVGSVQIGEMEKSITTALSLRTNIIEYIFCVPRSLGSEKFGRGKKGAGKKPILNTEEKLFDEFTDKIETAHTATSITWWFEQDLELQILEVDNEGIHKFWFDKELISIKHLIQRFDQERQAWLDKRYIPELHGQGVIQSEIQQLLFSETYRKGLLKNIESATKVFHTAVDLISRFVETLPLQSSLVNDLTAISDQIQKNLSDIVPVTDAIEQGVSKIPPVTLSGLTIPPKLIVDIDSILPNNRQLGIQDRLTSALSNIDVKNLQTIITESANQANQTGRLFLGNPGTGKTHALSNTVDVKLNIDVSPAIIIRANGSACTDWTQILKKALDLEGWNQNEILSALETLAIRTDHRLAQATPPGKDMGRETSKVVICIDGLEEDVTHWSEWYERMRQSVGLMNLYPRVRFVYTARPYFLDPDEVPKDPGFKVTEIPNEGDVPILSVIDQYFSPEHFNIEINPRSLIRGIDSLYALRLFCELYRGQVLTADSELLTAERQLLNKKVNQIEIAYRKIKSTSSSRNPIREGIGVLAELFYKDAEINHTDLVAAMHSGALSYFTLDETDGLIEYLVQNGFLTKSELPSGSGILVNTIIVYNLPYQSIMELIMAEKYVESINSGSLTDLPAHLVAPAPGKKAQDHLLNERIVKQIVNQLFHDHNKLIGVENFISKGIDTEKIQELQIGALIQAPPSVAQSFKERIDELFYRDHTTRSFVFENLIYPAAASSTNYFGADYLHELLIKQGSSFEREKYWLGWDRHEIHTLGKEEAKTFDLYSLENVIDPYERPLHLPEFSLHNEYPLIYGWALSTLNQSFRERLRNALTEWALKQPDEYVRLLEKLYPCNDPQIQEDLAAITLGIASRIKNKDSLALLATWTLKNVFSKPSDNLNIIVRTGFRSIVEKAFIAGVLNEEEVKKSRPKAAEQLSFLLLDQKTLTQGGDEIYPIVHDLAWYVIKKSFDDFLEYESVDENDTVIEPGSVFLKAYVDKLGIKHVSTYSWAISAAIAYMKSLGFSRTKENGNSYTDATHGSKSKYFTLEEKYTWLAVHFLQGYLSDYLPLKESGKFIDDYMKITDIPNPAELIASNKYSHLVADEDNWLIKEQLAPEMDVKGTADEKIKQAVEVEPVINFENWLEFKSNEIGIDEPDGIWLALFNYTTVHDSQSYIYASVDIRGVIILKGQARSVIDLIKNHPRRSHFVEHIDNMVGSPDTETYSNPSDIVWMSWIQESDSGLIYYLPPDGMENPMHYTVTSVTKNTVDDGEEEIYIPSKFVRNLLEISEMDNTVFVNDKDELMGINHFAKSSQYDRQEISLVRKKELLEQLDKNGFEIVWFTDLYKSKNALNKSVESTQHPMRTVKYFTWYENGEMFTEKFWDARFSNRRDEDEEEDDDNNNDLD